MSTPFSYKQLKFYPLNNHSVVFFSLLEITTDSYCLCLFFGLHIKLIYFVQCPWLVVYHFTIVFFLSYNTLLCFILFRFYSKQSSSHFHLACLVFILRHLLFTPLSACLSDVFYHSLVLLFP